MKLHLPKMLLIRENIALAHNCRQHVSSPYSCSKYKTSPAPPLNCQQLAPLCCCHALLLLAFAAAALHGSTLSAAMH
eukprot:361314-Chlamydomonas_euryale.AAC.1